MKIGGEAWVLRAWGLALTVALVIVAALGACGLDGEAASRGTTQVPQFEVDPTWPKQLPNNWMMGQAPGVFVDSRDEIWVLQRPTSLHDREQAAALDPPRAMCCVPAPSVIVFDTDGNVLKAWGGPGHPLSNGEVWPDDLREHGIFVDHEGYVWLGFRNHIVMKFTNDGEHVLTLGEHNRTGGSNDTRLLGGPTSMHVDPETDEIFIADGYDNRRVMVFNAESGRYLRHWGAYGELPDDALGEAIGGAGTYDPGAPPVEQFRMPVHGLAYSNDGLLYISDRMNNRIQVFRPSGEYVEEKVVAPLTLGSGSAWEITLSEDPEQEFLYLADGTNFKIWILRRDGLEIVGEFGHGGRQVGQFIGVHDLAVDSQGNVYTGEVYDAKRVQKFTRIR